MYCWRQSRLITTGSGIPFQPTELHWRHWKNSQSDSSYTLQKELVEKRQKIDEEGEGKTTAKEHADAPREYAVDRIVRHVSEVDNVRYALQWYGYTSEDETVQPPEHSCKILFFDNSDNR